jgi:hypothetical protein
MESLLHYLNKQPSSSYTEGENQKIAEYLTGKLEPDDLKPFLKEIRYLTNSSEAREIGQEVAENLQLMPRLGRFLRLMRSVTDINVYFEFVIGVSEGGLTFEQMYESGGLGAAAMLVDVLYRLSS